MRTEKELDDRLKIKTELGRAFDILAVLSEIEGQSDFVREQVATISRARKAKYIPAKDKALLQYLTPEEQEVFYS